MLKIFSKIIPKHTLSDLDLFDNAFENSLKT